MLLLCFYDWLIWRSLVYLVWLTLFTESCYHKQIHELLHDKNAFLLLSLVIDALVSETCGKWKKRAFDRKEIHTNKKENHLLCEKNNSWFCAKLAKTLLSSWLSSVQQFFQNIKSIEALVLAKIKGDSSNRKESPENKAVHSFCSSCYHWCFGVAN